MALTKRERNIGIGVGVLAVAFILDQVVVEPYLTALSEIKDQTSKAVAQQKENTLLFEKQTRMKKVWDEILAGGLKADDSAAESQAVEAAIDWAQSAGVNITAVKPERSPVVKDFEVISFHLTGTASTPALARLLQSFETASIPVKVDDLTITPRKEGTDDLTVQLSWSTLCLKPSPDSSAKTAVTDADTEVQSWNQ